MQIIFLSIDNLAGEEFSAIWVNGTLIAAGTEEHGAPDPLTMEEMADSLALAIPGDNEIVRLVKEDVLSEQAIEEDEPPDWDDIDQNVRALVSETA